MRRRRPVHVRWLGAFAKRGSLFDAARWELRASAIGLERPWALQWDRGTRRVGGAAIGLLVDPSSSVIKKITVGDGYSRSEDGKCVASPLYEWRVVTRPSGAVRPATGDDERVDRPWQAYDEVTGVPHLVAVVVHPGAPKRVRRMAAKMAKAIGLPYIGSLRNAHAFLQERR